MAARPMVDMGGLDPTHRKRQRRDGWGPEHRTRVLIPEHRCTINRDKGILCSLYQRNPEQKESARSMKRAVSILSQFLLFLFVDAAGSIFYHPFHIQTALSGSALVQRSFVWDGVILMLLVYLLMLLIAALRKRLRFSAPASTVALALAGLAGYLEKFGFITHNW